MAQERECSQPDVMPFDAGGGEFQRALGGQDKDGSVERGRNGRSLGQGVIVLDIENGLDDHLCKSVSISTTPGKEKDLRLRPLLPSSAGLLVGCLLLHMTARSYGASQTHRL